MGESRPLSNTWFPGPTRVPNTNGISTGAAVFAGLTNVKDRQTDRPTDHATRSVTIGRTYICSTAIRPNNNNKNNNNLIDNVHSVKKILNQRCRQLPGGQRWIVSIVFVRWRQCDPKYASLGPSECTTQTASRSAQQCHQACQGYVLSPKMPLCMGRSGPHLIYGSLSPQTKQHLDQFSCFCRAHDCKYRPHPRT